MNIFELLWFLVHLLSLFLVTVLFHRNFGWPVSVLAGAIGVGFVVVLEWLLKALPSRGRD